MNYLFLPIYIILLLFFPSETETNTPYNVALESTVL